jgi:hypothetical protein
MNLGAPIVVFGRLTMHVACATKEVPLWKSLGAGGRRAVLQHGRRRHQFECREQKRFMNERSVCHGAGSEATKQSEGAAASAPSKRQTWIHFLASFLASLVVKLVHWSWMRDFWEWFKEWIQE